MILQPVIHIRDIYQVKRNIEIILNCDINHIWLINHDLSKYAYEDLLDIYNTIRESYPGLWIGINILQLDPIQASIKSKEFKGLNGFWLDNPYIEYDLIKAMEIRNNIDCQYYGGVAFKYQRQPTNLEYSCKLATQILDVATTSGPKTGVGPAIDKIKNIRNYLGNHKFAIASGMNSENIKIFSEYIDYALVASSICDEKNNIIEKKLKELI